MKGRYSPAECIGIRKERIEGKPDPKHVSTSYAERQNLTMRMQMRRFTRLTNAFSKKFENHMHMVALYTVWYNYVKQHKSLKGLSPAMAGGLSDTLWTMTTLRKWLMRRCRSRASADLTKRGDQMRRLILAGLTSCIVATSALLRSLGTIGRITAERQNTQKNFPYAWVSLRQP